MIVWLTGQPGSGKTTLAKALMGRLKQADPTLSFMNIDGDHLRTVIQNQDYSLAGRMQNIATAQHIALFLEQKGFIPIVSLVAPYKNLREELKKRTKVLEVFCHTTEVRGREHFFATDYEGPESNFIDMDTTDKSVGQCVNDIADEFWHALAIESEKE